MKVKICGITRLEDAELAVALGAWALGFIFYAKSPRYVTPAKAAAIAAKLKGRAELAGVFVNASAAEIASTARAAGLTLVQLHGDEPAEFCSKLAVDGARKIRAARPATPADVDALASCAADYYLIDAPATKAGEYGGTGRLSSWELALAAKRHGPVLLSGGLHAGNVAEAIARVAPEGVDVSSGVEDEPGVKSAEKLEKLFKSIRGGK